MARTKEEEHDIETGHRSSSRAAAPSSNNAEETTRHECLDGSKTWHSTCLLTCALLVNVGFLTMSVVLLFVMSNDSATYYVKADRYRLVFVIFLLIASIMGLLASALYHVQPRLLWAANVLYVLTAIVYLPVGFLFSRSGGAPFFLALLLVLPTFFQTKLLYILQDPPDNSQTVNPARARAIAAPRTDYFDGSQQWQYPCMRICAALVNLVYLVLSIVLLVDLVNLYQARTSDYLITYNDQYLANQMPFKLAFGLVVSLFYLSLKGTLGALLLQRHLLILAGCLYPFLVVIFVSVATYYGLLPLLGLGMSLIVPPVLLGKLYMLLVYGSDPPDITIDRPAEPTTQSSNGTRTKISATVFRKAASAEEPTETTASRRNATTTPNNRISTTKRESQPYPSLNESSRRESIRSETALPPKKSPSKSKRQESSRPHGKNNTRQSQKQTTREASFDEDLPSPPPTKRPSQLKKKSTKK